MMHNYSNFHAHTEPVAGPIKSPIGFQTAQPKNVVRKDFWRLTPNIWPSSQNTGNYHTHSIRGFALFSYITSFHDHKPCFLDPQGLKKEKKSRSQFLCIGSSTVRQNKKLEFSKESVKKSRG
jgi:hypothetical protein